jgi:hypothetical protein
VINASAADTDAASTAICERISRNHRKASDADDDRRSQ